MKRLALFALLLLGGALSAHADSDVYDNIARHPRGDDALQADTNYCSQTPGAPQNGRPTPKAYKHCMLTRGWRYRSRGPRSRERRHVSRSRQSRPVVQGFHHRRHHRIELLEFLKGAGVTRLLGPRRIVARMHQCNRETWFRGRRVICAGAWHASVTPG